MSLEASFGAMAKIKLRTPVGDGTLAVLSNVTHSIGNATLAYVYMKNGTNMDSLINTFYAKPRH